ncbi:terminase small subunit [Mycobacterium phage CRB2]|uniref:Terminase small subunit n=1 Tax=Mycobacterium phage CRB2 TaxID=2483623 RepID=A0A455LN94_9CAUD|nr:terminase small subunit [Mycobacterium phage CRB2]AYP69993.1 terminase small subunit [Mycobacterium phage CRB2]
MTNRLIYLVGQPGSGKSTLMADLTAHFDRHHIGAAPDYPVAHDVLTSRPDGRVVGAELGVRRQHFGGTDALPSSIIEKAVPWIETTPYQLVLAEGARLANRRFIQAAINGSYQPVIVLLDHPQAEEWRKARSEELGRTQDPSWVKGRLTSSRRLAEWAKDQAIEVIEGHPDEIAAQLGEIISQHG